MHYLQFGKHRMDLREGELLIGRAPECEVVVDDPLVSRHHAKIKVSADGVTLEDLKSRNGMKVNGKRVEGSMRLLPGDVVSVGKQTLRVVSDLELGQSTNQPTRKLQLFGMLATVADKALALGNGAEAERLLSRHLQQILQVAKLGEDPGEENVAHAASYALKLAQATHNAAWVELFFNLHLYLRRPCQPQAVDDLHSILRNIKGMSLAPLDAYLRVLEELDLNPADRFLLSRLAGLRRVVAAGK